MKLTQVIFLALVLVIYSNMGLGEERKSNNWNTTFVSYNSQLPHSTITGISIVDPGNASSIELALVNWGPRNSPEEEIDEGSIVLAEQIPENMYMFSRTTELNTGNKTAYVNVNRSTLDLVVSSLESVQLYRRLEDGGYEQEPSFESPSQRAGQIGIADFDRNGIKDYVFGSYLPSTTEYKLLSGDENLGFSESKTSVLDREAVTDSIAVGDLNNDDKIDFVIVNRVTLNSPGIDTLNVHVNGDGFSVLEIPLELSTSPRNLKLVDVNHDGKLDIVVLNSNRDKGSSLDVYFNKYRKRGLFKLSRPLAFEKKISIDLALEHKHAAVGLAVGNIDNNKDTDVFITGFRTELSPFRERIYKDGFNIFIKDLINYKVSSKNKQYLNAEHRFHTTTDTISFEVEAYDINRDGKDEVLLPYTPIDLEKGTSGVRVLVWQKDD